MRKKNVELAVSSAFLPLKLHQVEHRRGQTKAVGVAFHSHRDLDRVAASEAAGGADVGFDFRDELRQRHGLERVARRRAPDQAIVPSNP